MRAEPFTISKQPQGYLLTLPGRQPSLHRFRRQALSHAKLATRDDAKRRTILAQPAAR